VDVQKGKKVVTKTMRCTGRVTKGGSDGAFCDHHDDLNKQMEFTNEYHVDKEQVKVWADLPQEKGMKKNVWNFWELHHPMQFKKPKGQKHNPKPMVEVKDVPKYTLVLTPDPKSKRGKTLPEGQPNLYLLCHSRRETSSLVRTLGRQSGSQTPLTNQQTNQPTSSLPPPPPPPSLPHSALSSRARKPAVERRTPEEAAFLRASSQSAAAAGTPLSEARALADTPVPTSTPASGRGALGSTPDWHPDDISGNLPPRPAAAAAAASAAADDDDAMMEVVTSDLWYSELIARVTGELLWRQCKWLSFRPKEPTDPTDGESQGGGIVLTRCRREIAGLQSTCNFCKDHTKSNVTNGKYYQTLLAIQEHFAKKNRLLTRTEAAYLTMGIYQRRKVFRDQRFTCDDRQQCGFLMDPPFTKVYTKGCDDFKTWPGLPEMRLRQYQASPPPLALQAPPPPPPPPPPSSLLLLPAAAAPDAAAAAPAAADPPPPLAVADVAAAPAAAAAPPPPPPGQVVVSIPLEDQDDFREWLASRSR
jgi:hypothetical protein